MEFVETVEDLKDAKGTVYAENVQVFTTSPVEFSPSDALKAAIANKDVKTESRTIEVPVKENSVVVKVYRQSYTKCIAVSEAGALALPAVNGDMDEVWKFVSQRADAIQYADVYNSLKNVAAGPEAAVKKFAKMLDSFSAEQIAAIEAKLAERKK